MVVEVLVLHVIRALPENVPRPPPKAPSHSVRYWSTYALKSLQFYGQSIWFYTRRLKFFSFLKCKCNFLYNSKMQKSMILEMFSSNSQGSLRACLFRLEKEFTLKSISIPWFVSFLKVQIKQGPRRMWGLHFASQKKFSNYLCSIFKSLLGTCLYCISDRNLNINIPFHIQGLQCGNKNHYVSLKSKLRFLSVDMKDTASKK